MTSVDPNTFKPSGAIAHPLDSQKRYTFGFIANVFLIAALLLGGKVNASGCLGAFASIIQELEIMDISDERLEQLRALYKMLEQNDRLFGMYNGVLSNGRSGQFWGRLEISKSAYIELGGTPRMIRGKLWIPVLFGKTTKRRKSEPTDTVLQYVSVESLYRLYGDKFFSDLIDPTLTYLIPVKSIQRHVFKLVRILKFEGEKVLVKDLDGQTKRVTKLELFAANISLLLWGNGDYTLSLDSMRDYFAHGGRGDIFLSELSTAPQHGALVRFEGFYIRITKMPVFTYALFSSKEAYDLMKANLATIPLLYTWGTSFNGVSLPLDSPTSVNLTNRLGFKKRSPFIAVTLSTEAETFVHEKTHFLDDLDPKLGAFSVQVKAYVDSKSLPEEALAITYWAVTERRAYAAQLVELARGLGQSEAKDRRIRYESTRARNNYNLYYLESFQGLVANVRKKNSKLADFLVKSVSDLTEGTEILESGALD